MATKWVDFTELKRSVPIREVLERYGYLAGLIEKKPGKLVGPCPLHGGKNATSFHVDTDRNIWNCFSGCRTPAGKSGGNVLDLVMVVEQCEIRDAGLKLAEWFGLDFDRTRRDGTAKDSAKVSEKSDGESDACHTSQQVDDDVVNPPLARPLQNLNHDHPYLAERGLTVPTIKHFGVGHCTRGIMRGRIAIPIHDDEGQLVAYAGRAVSEELASEKGKYRLPDNFKKSHVVWNLHRVREHEGRGLVVVEGFFGAMTLHQTGFPNVVALMGSTLSDRQEQLLLCHTDRLALMLDGDDAGTACKRDLWSRLVRKLYIRDIHLEDGEQPDSLDADRIRTLLS